VLHFSLERALRNGCNPLAAEAEYRKAGTHIARLSVYGNCRDGAEVALWRLAGAGYGWPGTTSNREALVGPATRVIEANTEIWKFFSRFSLPRSIQEERRVAAP
jgi:poly(3-hydroxybutyrate) depolymerase